jgi:hypothetical protein
MRDDDSRQLRRPASLRRRIALGAVVALAALVLAPPAGAHHIRGASYAVDVFGLFSGGFTVSQDGSEITEVHTNGLIPGDICVFSAMSATYNGSLPIVNHSFSDTAPPLTFSGSFNEVQSAEGTVQISSAGCSTINAPWTATTNASPAGSEECSDATAVVDDANDAVKTANKQVKKAKKKVKKAQSSSSKKKAKKKLKKAKKKQNQAKNELATARQDQASVC